MHCGCPLPGNTIGQRLKRLTAILSSQSNGTSNALHPPAHHPAAYNGTHPSDHNSVHVPSARANTKSKSLKKGIPQTFADARAIEMKARRERDAKAVQQGKMDAAQYKRGNSHDYAFLMPVPFYIPVAPIGWGIDIGPGWNTGGLGACAVVSQIFSASRFASDL